MGTHNLPRGRRSQLVFTTPRERWTDRFGFAANMSVIGATFGALAVAAVAIEGPTYLSAQGPTDPTREVPSLFGPQTPTAISPAVLKPGTRVSVAPVSLTTDATTLPPVFTPAVFPPPLTLQHRDITPRFDPPRPVVQHVTAPAPVRRVAAHRAPAGHPGFPVHLFPGHGTKPGIGTTTPGDGDTGTTTGTDGGSSDTSSHHGGGLSGLLHSILNSSGRHHQSDDSDSTDHSGQQDHSDHQDRDHDSSDHQSSHDSDQGGGRHADRH